MNKIPHILNEPIIRKRIVSDPGISAADYAKTEPIWMGSEETLCSLNVSSRHPLYLIRARDSTSCVLASGA
jgi:hypothetical protein